MNKSICTEDGNFKKFQCDDEKCWCVNKVNGKHVPNTKKIKSRFQIDCDQPFGMYDFDVIEYYFMIIFLPFTVHGCKVEKVFLNGEQLGDIVNGYLPIGKKLEYVCNNNFKLLGPKYRRCIPKGQFAKEMPKCVKT